MESKQDCFQAFSRFWRGKGLTVWRDVVKVPCTWSRGSMRFFSAGMYFRTTVSSPRYCMVESVLPSACATHSHRVLSLCIGDVWEQKGTVGVREVSPWAAERTTPLSRCPAPTSQRSAPPPRESCCVRSGRGATRTLAGCESPAASGWSRTARRSGTWV